MHATPEVLEEARLRWIAGDNVHAIAFAVGAEPVTIYWWKRHHGWPSRKRLQPWRPPRQSNIVDLAAKLWADGLPRPDIASLCGVCVGTIAVWRVRYGWELRQGGHCKFPEWERQYRRTGDHAPRPKSDRQIALRNLFQALAAEKPDIMFHVKTPHWRCCDQLLDIPACPTCHRKNPLVAA